jgi:hypothetical protein
MSTKAITPAPVKVASKSLLDSPAFRTVTAWVLMQDGNHVGKVFWTSGEAVKCCIIIHGKYVKSIFGFEPEQPTERFTSLVIGSAGGGGYDKKTASFNDCLRRNGATVQADESAGADDFLQSLGLTIIRVF